MTLEQKIEAYTMYIDGHSMQEIGEKFGVSKQRISQILGMGKPGRKPWADAKYKNIRKWLNEHNMSQADLAAGTKIVQTNISNIISGKHEPSKKAIDKILAFTGMTYEEAFKEE